MRGRFPVNLPSQAYEKYREMALEQIWLSQMGKEKIKTLTPPYRASYKFFMKGKLDTDLDNMIAGVNDILQDAGIIDDDKNITEYGFARKISGEKDWRAEIIIEEI